MVLRDRPRAGLEVHPQQGHNELTASRAVATAGSFLFIYILYTGLGFVLIDTVLKGTIYYVSE